MKKSIAYHILFWVIIASLLTTYFGKDEGDYTQSFFFVTFLMPVAIGTTYFFNYFLLPIYLLTEKYFKFILYFIYMVIFSLYAEMIVITVSFVVLANYQYKNLNPLTVDVYSLAIVIYLIVFLIAFIRLLRSLKQSQSERQKLHEKIEKNEQEKLFIQVDRKQTPIDLDELLYIESLADYVKVITSVNTYITREKISHLENKLPEYFIRIHRSFIVNKKLVRAFNREAVEIGDQKLPVSRTYKKRAMETLEK